MKIEVVLIDSIDGDNLTSLKNYDEIGKVLKR